MTEKRVVSSVLREPQKREAGRELDAEIAELILGATWGEPRRDGESTLALYGWQPVAWRYVDDPRMVFSSDLREYSTKIEPAFQVVEAMRAKGWAYCRVQSFIADYGESTQRVEWWAEFNHDRADNNGAASPQCDTPALAICLAALEATRDKWAAPLSENRDDT